MKPNESIGDRILRIAISVAPLALGAFLPGSLTLRLVLAILGLYLILTGLTGFCPLYALFHFNTRR
jgi:hypothetical protein